MKSQTLEQRLLYILTNPQPLPKYELWQQVEFKYDDSRAELNQGRIVGYYWESVEAAIFNDGYPGWYYVIEGGSGWVYHILEEDITPVAGGSDEANHA